MQILSKGLGSEAGEGTKGEHRLDNRTSTPHSPAGDEGKGIALPVQGGQGTSAAKPVSHRHYDVVCWLWHKMGGGEGGWRSGGQPFQVLQKLFAANALAPTSGRSSSGCNRRRFQKKRVSVRSNTVDPVLRYK